jgi:hypothetical protein
MSQLFVQIATPGSGAEVPRNFEVTGGISVQFTHTQAHLTRSSVNVQFGDNGPVVAATFLTPTTWRCIGQLDPSLAPGTPVNIKVTANGLIQFPIGPGEPGSEDVQATATLAVRVVSPLCPSNLPLVLLPVRLETRFFSLPNSVTELRVRIYPDKIHLDSHEPDLLPTENEWGTHYWEQDWRAGSDATARATAWRQLADRFGAERAAWIARVLQPTNARPTTATAPNQPLNPAPIFPAVTVATDGKDSAWRHAPQARLMPDRWIAVLKFGATSIQVVGRDIARPLYVGPDPNPRPPPPPVPDDQLQLDPGMKWMVDFDEAEAKGMGLRITVPAAALSAGLDSLFVFGVAGKLGSDAAKQFANLLDAHHYTDGLEFLGFGTPTNNTDERRAAATHDDPEHERSYAIEVASDPMALDPQSNAVRVGTALGLPATAIVPVFGRVGQAAERHGLDMRSMNAALWQVGWGYYLSNMVGFDGTGLTPTILAWARDHFVNNVRSGGPYPALRCGHQPYGVLPVTSLDQWKPPTGQEQAMAPDSWLRDLLMKLRNNIWRPRVGDAFRLGRRSPSAPDADLADIMRMDGLASGYSARTMLGRHYLQHLRAFLGEDLAGNGFIATHDALAAGILQRLGIAWRPRLARTVGADTAWAVSAPLVQDGEVSPWRGLEPNYIAALLAQPSIAALTQARPDPASSTTTTSLLQLLLRHALLRELADAAALVAGSVPGGDPTPFLRDAELIDLVTDPPQPAPSPPWTRRLDQPAPGIAGSPTMRQYLEGLTTFDTPATASLGDFRRSLIHLKNRDSETLQYLMQGTLDLSSHRLDAWITSFATKRLATMMAGAPQGAYVGAYGWVEKLRPTPASSVTAVTTLPAGEAGPLVTRNNDSGFIHAPSMTHAAAAALLRNAHLGPTGTPAPDSPFAIDLSSRRAREAKRLLDGLRQGQPLGALLGFSLERALHDIELDIAIAGLRKLSPLAARPLDDGGGATEAIAANNVVDGLDLARKWQSNQQTVLDAAHPANTPPFTQDQINGLTRELNALADAIDGLSDALTAEAAYQVARGNTSRVASTLAAIAQGDAPPPELEVIRTPRTGTPLTHRLIVLFSGNPVVNPGWLATNSSPRASAEPMLNAWASKLIGNGTKIRCTIERLDDTTGAVVETRTLPLSEVAVGALDMVYGVEAITSGTQPDGSLSEVEQQILYYAKHKTGGFDPQATIRLQHARPTNLAAGETTLFDALEQARSVRRLLSAVRGAEPEDLNPPERTGAGTIDLVDLEARVVRAENALNAANSALKALVAPTATTTTAEALRTGLMKMGAFGIGPYVPVVAAGESPAAIATLGLQAKALLKTSGARLEQVAALRLVTAATDPRARRDQLVARMRNVFGQAFVVLPRFACDATGAAELTAALAASKQTQGGDPLAAHGWFAQYSRVRDTMGRMSACLRGAEVLATGERLNLSVAQLPLVAGERWVGLPPVPDTALPPGKLSLVLQTLATINTAQPLTGLLVDEWTETVPSTRETTAITFQFDPPDACPPQCVLVAVPPVPGVDWTSDALRQVLEETLDLAKLRAVDAETLGEVAHYMPALYLAFNAKDDAVSTDFAALTH